MQHTATKQLNMQHTATPSKSQTAANAFRPLNTALQHSATHCNTQQMCNTLQHTTNVQHTATHNRFANAFSSFHKALPLPLNETHPPVAVLLVLQCVAVCCSVLLTAPPPE